MSEVILYQFELCPYCQKVRAALDAKGIAYRTVEVNPMSKAELPPLAGDEERTVPMLTHGGDTLRDSSHIMAELERRFPTVPPLVPEDAARRQKSAEVAQWVDDAFIMALPTVLYGTWGEARKAAQVTARTSNFGFFSNFSVRTAGPMVMHQVAKRILKRHGRSDGHAWVEEGLDQFETWLGEGQFVAGDTLTLGDLAMHGAISCVREFPVFESILARPQLAAWFARVQALRDAQRQRLQ